MLGCTTSRDTALGCNAAVVSHPCKKPGDAAAALSATGDGDLTVTRAPSAYIIQDSPGHADLTAAVTLMTLMHSNDHTWHDQDLVTRD
jgi:hypothetical protein